MSNRLRFARLVIPAVVAMFSAPAALAAACTTVATGNWNAQTTWGAAGTGCVGAPGGIPGAADTVTIAAAHTVTVTANAAAASIAIAAPSVAAHGININPGIVLNVGGAVTLAAPAVNRRTSTLAVGAGTLNAASIAINGGATGTRISQVTVSTGAITTTGAITFGGKAAQARLISTGASTINVGGNFIPGAFTSTGSTLNINGGAAQTVGGAFTYNNLTINKAAGTATLGGAATVGGALSVNAGALAVGAFTLTVNGATSVGGTLNITSATGAKTFVGAVTVNPGGVWTNATAAVTFRGGLTHNGATFTAGTGIHTFSTTAAQAINCAAALAIPSVTVTAPTVLTNNCLALTVATALAGTGNLTNGAAATLNIGGTAAITTLNAAAAGNTVNYTGAAQTVKATTYHHLGLAGSGAKTAAAGLTVNGDLTLSGTATFAAGAFTHNFAGNWIVDTTAAAPLSVATTSLINFNTPAIPAATTVGGTTAATLAFADVNINNTSGVIFNENASFSAGTTPTLTVAAGATLMPAPAVVISGAGTLTGAGTVQVTRTAAVADFSSQYPIATKTLTNLTVEYIGAASQIVSALTYGSAAGGGLKVNNASGVSLAADTTVAGVLTLENGVVNAGGFTLISGGDCTTSLLRTGGHVAGLLQLAFPTGAPNCTFHVGDAAAYRPISVGFASVTAAGSLVGSVSQAAGDHPNIASSGLDSAKSVNRYWTLTNPAGGTIAYTTYAATFNFINPTDIDAGANPLNFEAEYWNGASWTTTGIGARTASSNQATGVSAPSVAGASAAFAVGEKKPVPPSVVSIVRASADPTTPATVVSWTVTFSESVTGVDASDFVLAPAGGVSGAAITLVSGGGAVWTVSANTGSGSGTLGLNLVDDDSILDATSLPLGGAGAGNGNFTGEIYTVNAAPFFQAAGTAVGGAGAVSPAWPAHAIDDLALLFVESTGGQPVTLSVPAGFAPVPNSPQATGTGLAGTQITVFWARATSTTMAAPTVADPGNHVYAQIITYRGVINTGNPWDVTGGGVKAAASASVTVTGVTTTVPDTLIVQAVARDTDSAAAAFSAQTNANLTGIAERSDAGTISGNGGGFAVWDGIKATAGATGDTAATVTSSINAFLTIALKPMPSAATADHFSINHSGAGITCQAEPITITAHDALHNTFTAQTASITLSTSTGLGDWSLISGSGTLTPGAVNSGSAAYAFAAGDNGQVTLGLKHTAAGSVSLGVTDGTATLTTGAGAGEADPAVVYSDAGFSVTDSAGNPVNIGSQVAGQVSGTLYLQAVKTAPNGACTGVFNTTVNIEMASQCNNPATCAGRQVTVNATALNVGYPDSTVPGGSGLPGVNVPLAFGANSIAPFTLNYPDVGQIRLYARYNMLLRDGTPSGNYMVGGSNAFVVKPGGFMLSGIMRTSDGFANPAAADATGAKFVRAGEAFTATVTATTIDGVTATPNYGQETAPESVKLNSALAPGLGLTNNPAIGGVFGAFTNGAATGAAFTWNEAGIITLTPSVADADYLGAGDVTGTASGNVGRFYAGGFAISGGVIANRSGLAGCAAPAGCGAFTYMGEEMSAVFNLTAKAMDGTTTLQNYNYSATPANNFAKLDPTAMGNPLGLGAVDTGAPRTVATLDTATYGAASGNFAGGVASVTAPFAVMRGASPNGPFDALEVGIAPVDGDGAALAALDLAVNAAGAPNTHGRVGGTKARYGRLKLSNAHGSELLPLPINAIAQYWNGATYLANTLDSNSMFAAADVLFSNYRKNLAAGETGVVTPPASVTFLNGIAGYRLSKPGAGNDGSVDMTVSVMSAYLPGNTARATFGVYKGNDEFIYLRELY